MPAYDQNWVKPHLTMQQWNAERDRTCGHRLVTTNPDHTPTASASGSKPSRLAALPGVRHLARLWNFKAGTPNHG